MAAGRRRACPAHLVYSPPLFDGRGLRPIVRALVGVLEDARVETLAGRGCPGCSAGGGRGTRAPPTAATASSRCCGAWRAHWATRSTPIITSDGFGGAIILWQDRESGAGVCGLYAQRINSNGETLWATNGIPICTSPFTDPIQFHPVIVSDGEAGAIVAWDDTRNANTRVYAQRVNGDGSLQWLSNGVQISQLPGEDRIQAITNVGENEFVIAWTNGISTFTETDIYAQKINASGIKMWSISGITISTSPENQYNCVMTMDQNYGAILCWDDRRNVETNIYAQKIDSSGVIKWQLNGVPVCVKANYQFVPRIISDENNGAMICWLDHDGNNFDIYGQRIDESGLIKWQIGGVD